MFNAVVERGASALIAAVMSVSAIFSPAPPDTNKYLALGDSITTGYGLADKEESFAAVTAKILGMELDNLAVDGMTSAGLLETVLDEKNEDKIKNAELITISIGGNDFLQLFFGIIRRAADFPENATFTDLQQALLNIDNLLPRLEEELAKPETGEAFKAAVELFAVNLDRIIAEIRRLNPNAKIVVQTLYNPFSGAPVFSGLEDFADKYTGLLNAEIFAQSKNFSVADTAKAFAGRGLELTNILFLDVHPNKAGHRMIAGLVANEA